MRVELRLTKQDKIRIKVKKTADNYSNISTLLEDNKKFELLKMSSQYIYVLYDSDNFNEAEKILGGIL